MEPLTLLHQEQAALQETKLLDSRHAQALFGRHSFCIEIDPDDNRSEAFLVEPYIKLGNANTIRQSQYVLRIGLRDAKVIYHAGPSIRVTKTLLKELNKAMMYQSSYNQMNGTVLGCINLYLQNLAAEHNLLFAPILNVDFTKATGERKFGGDYKLC